MSDVDRVRHLCPVVSPLRRTHRALFAHGALIARQCAAGGGQAFARPAAQSWQRLELSGAAREVEVKPRGGSPAGHLSLWLERLVGDRLHPTWFKQEQVEFGKVNR